MEILRGLIQNLIIIIILAMFLEMLLPAGEMRPYVNMVMGLLIIIAVIQTVGDLVNRDFTGALPALTEREGQVQLSEIIDTGREFSSGQQQIAIAQYKNGLDQQVLALAAIHQEIPVVAAEVKINSESGDINFGQINEIIMIVEKEPARPENQPAKDFVDVEPVAVQVNSYSYTEGLERAGSETSPPRETVAGLINTMANFYNLKPEQVKCVYR
ncbi:MAG: stage III sporulation protein AF [Desulfotomaculaceae bacterium]|nr:stage III sporulation protein AF [Desulfotomaculaceae bacterium]